MASLNRSISAGEVLAHITSGRADTRAGLARLTGLSRSTVAERLDLLAHAGLIEESSTLASTGGRPSKSISLRSESHLVLAADLGEDHVRLVVTDLAGTPLAESVTVMRISDGPGPSLDWIAEEGRRLVGQLGRGPEALLGLGLSVPAPVDFPVGQVVGPSVMTGWEGVDIQQEFRSRLDVPVLVENDVNARGLGEYLTCWDEVEHVLYVKAGTGIGSAILTGGEVFRGAIGAAGDIGHLRLDPQDGPLCRCGAIGCVEAFAAGWAIERDLSELGVTVGSTADVIATVLGGEPRAIHLVREAGRVLGRAIAYAVNLLNPSLVVVGGSLSGAGEHLMLGVRESVYQHSLSLATRDLRIAQAKGDERSGAVGAAHLVIREGLRPHRIDERLSAAMQRPRTPTG